MSIYEKLQERYQEFMLRLRIKGEERLTIMLIPHGQEKMFSLQLNWYMILFLVGSLCLAVFLAFYGLYLKQLHEREINRLQTLYGTNFRSALHLTESAGEIRAIRYELSERLASISTTLGVPEYERSILPDAGDADRITRLRLERETMRANPGAGPQTDYLPPVYALKSLHYALEKEQPLLRALQESIEDGLGVYSDMPMGRPFRSFHGLHDTSTYGVRVNPVTRVGFEFHTGFDTAGPVGTPIYATGPGTVYRVYNMNNGYGRAVVISHKFGLYSMFAHLNRIDVRQGETVFRNQRIGSMGRSGRATGTHLHYEIWSGTSQRIDPKPFVCSVDFNTRGCRDYHSKNAPATF
ncbi:MAG: M23 family metallopeptidase [Leptospirales bacterium]|jgi:murein DD-endopeptidase MepM/ murein hydrolase activator NlpD